MVLLFFSVWLFFFIHQSVSITIPFPKFITPININNEVIDRNSSRRVSIRNPIISITNPVVSIMNPIKYTIGNKVLTDNVNLYLIFYGASWTETQKNLIIEFANNIGSSDWYQITKLYYFQANDGANKIYVNGAVKVAATANDVGSMGNALTGTNLPDLVQNFISAGTLPEDEDGIYFIFTGDDVTESIRPDPFGTAFFCSDYCGYHVSTILESGKRIQYAMVGNPITQCSSSCGASVNQKVSPNGDPGVDSILSVFAHELTETVTDPISDILSLRAWQDNGGSENADKCSWKFGNVTTDPVEGFSYNLELGGRKYMIQENWLPTLQTCQMNL